MNDNEKLNVNISSSTHEEIKQLVSQELFCVLCTKADEGSWGSLMAFVVSGDFKYLFFCTPRSTHKYRLLRECGNSVIVIDNRCREQSDISRIQALTINGMADELPAGKEYSRAMELLEERYPSMADFLHQESTAIFKFTVSEYQHVAKFQNITRWVP